MDTINWILQTSAQGVLPAIVSEYLMNDLGVFTKSERRMPKKAPLTALTGFRVGYIAVPNTDYRMAPLARNGILWHKITSVCVDDSGLIIVRGNTKDVISILCTPENHDCVMQFIAGKRQLHPVVAEADFAAASWICWRDDDDWGDASATLKDMVREELETERFIEPEVLEETKISGVVDRSSPVVPAESPFVAPVAAPNAADKPVAAPDLAPSAAPVRPKFCSNCGELLPPDGRFCENCGNKITDL